MNSAWEIYDRLIEAIDPNVKVTRAENVGPCSEVTSSENSIGRALIMPSDSRPRIFAGGSMEGRSLKDIAVLAKSWNFDEASFGMAAVNAWWGQEERALGNGFEKMKSLMFRELFDPYAEETAGKTVGVIGHFPFVFDALPQAGQIYVLERAVRPGDYPDSACEYLLPECDYVFITGSAFVNKTIPRLLSLSRRAHTVVVGPSAACAPFLAEYGVDTVLGFTSSLMPAGKKAIMGNGRMYGARLIFNSHSREKRQ